MKRLFEVGEKVYYKGQKWEVADRLNNTYALWKSYGSKEQVDGWIPEEELSKVESSYVAELNRQAEDWEDTNNRIDKFGIDSED